MLKELLGQIAEQLTIPETHGPHTYKGAIKYIDGAHHQSLTTATWLKLEQFTEGTVTNKVSMYISDGNFYIDDCVLNYIHPIPLADPELIPKIQDHLNKHFNWEAPCTVTN